MLAVILVSDFCLWFRLCNGRSHYIRNASPLATKHAQKKQEKREPMTFLDSKMASVHIDRLTSCSYVTEEKKIQHTKTKIKQTKEEGEPPKGNKEKKELQPACNYPATW